MTPESDKCSILPSSLGHPFLTLFLTIWFQEYGVNVYLNSSQGINYWDNMQHPLCRIYNLRIFTWWQNEDVDMEIVIKSCHQLRTSLQSSTPIYFDNLSAPQSGAFSRLVFRDPILSNTDQSQKAQSFSKNHLYLSPNLSPKTNQTDMISLNIWGKCA